MKLLVCTKLPKVGLLFFNGSTRGEKLNAKIVQNVPVAIAIESAVMHVHSNMRDSFVDTSK